LTKGAKYGKDFKGRQRVLSDRDCRRLRKAASNTTASAGKLKNELSLKASRQTICRRLKEMNLIRKKMKSKPPLTPFHKAARLSFCRLNMQRDWSKVWFTDEKRWCLDGPDCYSYYWHDLRKEPLLRSKRQGGGGSLMVWGGFCGNRTTTLCFLSGKVNSSRYTEELQTHFMPFYAPNEFLVQDNASIHASNTTQGWLRDQHVTSVDWPSRSPDLNPIENVWGIMARRVYAGGKQYSCLRDLKVAITRCWTTLDPQELITLASSMTERIYQCVLHMGTHTKY
jgi:transposase